MLLLPLACGYRPVLTNTPAGVRSIRVLQPSPGPSAEPRLSQLLAAALVRELARRGVQASTAGVAEAQLQTRILGLEASRRVIAPARGRVAARDLQLRIECRLHRGGETLWRSGLVQQERTWPLHSTRAESSETARQMLLGRLAALAATQCVELMLSGL